MHTNTKMNEEREAVSPPEITETGATAATRAEAGTNGTAETKPKVRARPATRAKQRCAGCGVEKCVNAFRRREPATESAGEPQCRSCETHGVEKVRRRLEKKMALPPEGEKACRHCGERQALALFPKDDRCRDGYGIICSKCLERAQREPEEPREPALAEVDEFEDLLRPSREEKEWRASVGIAVAHATCPPWHRRTREELAAYANLTPAAIWKIEQAALEKMRKGLEEMLREAGLKLEDVL